MDPESSTIGDSSLAQTSIQATPFDDSSSTLVFGEKLELGSETTTPETTQDAQSAVLGNEDLLRLIFSFHTVDPLRDWGSTTTQPSPFRSRTSTTQNAVVSRDVLLKAALTCKAFFYPAVGALWQSIDSIVPLVKLIAGMVEEDSVWTTTTGCIFEEDLQRFDIYARLVRRLQISAEALQAQDGCVATHVLPAVHDHRPQGILPLLKVLEITGRVRNLRREDIWLLKSMVPSAGPLSHVIIKGIQDSTTEQVLVASILKSVQLKSPRLTTIALDVCQDWPIFNVVNSIESLRKLSLDFRKTYLGLPTQLPIRSSLSNLVNLHLTGSVFSVCLLLRTMLSSGLPRHLKNLQISLVPRPNKHNLDPKAAVQILVAEISKNDDVFLESLVIESDPCHQILELPVELLTNFSEPIYKELRALSIPVEHVSGLTFATLFAAPHRSLVWLDICSIAMMNGKWNTGFERSSEILEVIHDMVPNLKYLYMPILLNTGDDHVEFMARVCKRAPSHHGLEELRLKSFGVSKYPEYHHPSQDIADLLMIARCIDHLFPYLRRIDTEELQGIVEKRWLDGLEAAVKQFAAVRMMSRSN